ncbi:MAG: hypothetical protein NT075_26990 [Chloroflexi bacterium]|nr:hypothetical protein [Chloroflexota bacterium]
MSRLITLELPDEVYQRFKARSQKTKRSVEEELLTAFTLDLPVLPLLETGGLQAYNEVIEFLASGPSVSEIAQFKLSDETRQRANTLLVKERTQGVTEDEAKELDYYVDLGDFLGILRAKAQLQLHANIS